MESLLKILTTISAFTVILIYISKLVITKSADLIQKRIEADFQKDLIKYEKEMDTIGKKFQASLDKDIKEHELRFSKLHEERAMLIKDIYVLIYEMHKAIIDYVTIFQGSEWVHNNDRANEAKSKYSLAHDKFEKNRFFLDLETCKLIESILKETHTAMNDMTLSRTIQQINDNARKDGANISIEEGLEPRHKWRNLSDSVGPRVSEVRSLLADKFREIVGAN